MEQKLITGELKLADNDEQYYEFIRILRTDPRIIHGFIHNDPITPEQQRRYMKKYKNNYYICLWKNEPVGYVGQIDGDIRIATHPDFQQRGVGSFMINEIMKKHPECYGKVKIKNQASLSMFEKCGFKKKYYILERG